MSDRVVHVERLIRLLAHIQVPPSNGFPEINMVFMGPVERIAGWLYDKGVRVEEPEVE